MGGRCKLSGLKKRRGKRGNNQFGCKKPEEEDGVRERKRCGGCGEKWKEREKKKKREWEKEKKPGSDFI